MWYLRLSEKSGWRKDVGGTPRSYVLSCEGWMILGKSDPR